MNVEKFRIWAVLIDNSQLTWIINWFDYFLMLIEAICNAMILINS